MSGFVGFDAEISPIWPTAQASSLETLATANSTPLAMRGLGTTFHFDPSQCSISG
jgi:hypothetical protein